MSTKTKSGTDTLGESTTQKNVAPANPAVEKSQTTVNPEGKVKTESPKVEPKPLSVDDKLQLAAHITALSEDREKLKSHKNAIQKVQLNEFGEMDTFTIANSKGVAYVIKNSKMCRIVQTLLIMEIDKRIVEVENQITTAAI